MSNMNVVSAASIKARTRSGSAGRESSQFVKRVLELKENEALEIVFDEATEPPVNTEKGETRKATFDDFCNRRASVIARKGVVPFDYETRRIREENRFYVVRPAPIKEV